MTRRLAAILAAIPFVFTTATSSAQLSEAAKSALSRQISEAVDHGDTPGVVEIVVSPDRILYEQAAGKLDASRNVPMPVEEGKIGLDDPISKYLPGFDNPQVITNFDERTAKYETRPAKRPITIRHLLTNTSGLGYGFTNPVLNRLTKATGKSEIQLPLLSDPGEKWNYSPGTRVLGQLIEKLTGQSLEDFFQSRIFKPLGMPDTSYAVPASKQSSVPRQFSSANGSLKEQPERHPPAQ